MSGDWERQLDRSPEWQAVMDAVDAAAAKPSRARFEAVGRATVEWSANASGSPRDATSHSGSEVTIYMENGRYYADKDRAVEVDPGDGQSPPAFPPYDLSEHEALQQGVVDLDQ